MTDPADELIDYEEDDETVQITNGLLKHDSNTTSGTATGSGAILSSSATGLATGATSSLEKNVNIGGGKSGSSGKGYVGIHSTGFRDFLLKPELLHSIADCGFEHPSEGL